MPLPLPFTVLLFLLFWLPLLLLLLLIPREVRLLGLRDKHLSLHSRREVPVTAPVHLVPVLGEVVRIEDLLAHGALDGDVRALRIVGCVPTAPRHAQ